jgi:hypothetical protein
VSAFHVVATAVVYGAAVNALVLEAGWLGDHPNAVREAWADGCAWLADRRADVATAADTTARAVHAVLLPVVRAVCALLLAAVCAAGLRDRDGEVTA